MIYNTMRASNVHLFYTRCKVVFQTKHYHHSSLEGALEPRLQGAQLAAVLTLHGGGRGRGAGGPCRSWRAVGAEGNKSQPPAEQGHQIKVRCYDLVHPAVRGVRLVIKKKNLLFLLFPLKDIVYKRVGE